MKAIKTIDLQPGHPFEANGKKYIPSETFSIGRFEKVEELEEELLMFNDKRTCHAVMLKAMEHINKYKPGEAYMLMYNKIESDQRNAKVSHYMLRLCAAYINAEEEDLRYLSEETIKAKIEDWSAEGLDIRPFLVFAVNALGELSDRYRRPIQHILEATISIKESLEQALDIRTMLKETGTETAVN